MVKIEKKKIIVAAVVVLLGLVVAGVGWWYWPKELVKIDASGTIEAIEVEVSSKVPGNVVKMHVSEGDMVSEEAIVAEIDKAELSTMYNQALAVEKQARANLELAKKTYERAETLYRGDYASRQALDQAKAAVDAARAGYWQAQAAVKLAEIRLNDSKIKAPVYGHIIVKAVEEGELVSPGSPIVTIADLSTVYIMVYVTEIEAGRINIGNDAYVSVDSYPGEKFKGRVTFISKLAEFTPKTIQTKKERVNLVFAVKVEVPNPELKLKPGLPADAVIKL